MGWMDLSATNFQKVFTKFTLGHSKIEIHPRVIDVHSHFWLAAKDLLMILNYGHSVLTTYIQLYFFWIVWLKKYVQLGKSSIRVQRSGKSNNQHHDMTHISMEHQDRIVFMVDAATTW